MIDKPRNAIYLTGFMGAGKSTTGKALAKLLGFRFVDLDAVIVKQEGRSITDIFSTDGEEYFRDCETKLLKSLDPSITTVYATGGGIVQRDENRSMMRQTGLVIYLFADWPTLKMRLETSKDRPLVDPGKNWEELRQKWGLRQSYYRDADYIVNTDHLNSFQVAKNIKDLFIAG